MLDVVPDRNLVGFKKAILDGHRLGFILKHLPIVEIPITKFRAHVGNIPVQVDWKAGGNGQEKPF